MTSRGINHLWVDTHNMAYGYRYDYLTWLGHRAWNSATRSGPVEVFLYDDSEDDPGLDATMDDINTEPSDGNYARLTYSFDTMSVEREGVEVNTLFGEGGFDLTDTTGEVDSFGIVADFEHFEEMSEPAPSSGSTVELLVGTGPLPEPLVLDDYTGGWPFEPGTSLVSMY